MDDLTPTDVTAMLVLHAIISSPDTRDHDHDPVSVRLRCEKAYRYADALAKIRAARNVGPAAEPAPPG